MELWRAVATHLDLPPLLDAIRSELLAELRATAVVIRTVDSSRRRIDSRAWVSLTEAFQPPPPSVELKEDQLAALRFWCKEGSIRLVPRGRSAENAQVPRLLAPPELEEVWTVPLAASGGALGALLAVGSSLSEREAQAMLNRLQAPFAVALQNDSRLHELMRVREAMDADKQALLTRLDRHDISEPIIGAESGLREVTELIRLVAPTESPVLILGETGSGKEVVARAIHSGSRRKDGPIVRVNCGAIPSELIDSALFGHERGSFTGASQAHQGWFERADGGTLFLDEIGELPLGAQVRLLRVLQDGILERVGGHRSIQVDVRLVAATHRDLESMVQSGHFRKDLWYRIGTFPIRIPPLRERAQDIPTIAEHIAAHACKRLGIPPLKLEQSDLAQLLAYDWPGNVRELAAVMERATILGRGHSLVVAAALGQAVKRAAPFPAGGSLTAAMSKHIEAALAASHGRIEGPFGAAKALGVNPHTLRARMRRLGIDWRRFRAARAGPLAGAPEQ